VLPGVAQVESTGTTRVVHVYEKVQNTKYISLHQMNILLKRYPVPSTRFRNLLQLQRVQRLLAPRFIYQQFISLFRRLFIVKHSD
jgi:hypothetical protein